MLHIRILYSVYVKLNLKKTYEKDNCSNFLKTYFSNISIIYSATYIINIFLHAKKINSIASIV